jgi:hypothetical protein
VVSTIFASLFIGLVFVCTGEIQKMFPPLPVRSFETHMQAVFEMNAEVGAEFC